jgi:SnoaL-like domain
MAVGRIAAIAATVVALAAGVWFVTARGDEGAQIRRRLQAFADQVNKSTVDGQGPEVRAAQFGSYFTDDVEVDFGRGSAPIRGREVVVGMAERLQPRTAAFQLKLEDMTVAMGQGGDTADVHLTAAFFRRSLTTSEEWMDAREFTVGMRRAGGEWRIGRVTAVDTLK